MGILSMMCSTALPQHQETTATATKQDTVISQDILLATAVDDMLEGYQLTVTPVATHKILKVSMTGPQVGMVVEVYNSHDRRLIRQIGLSSTSMSVSVQYLPPGDYVMKILNQEMEAVQTFRLQKTIPL